MLGLRFCNLYTSNNSLCSFGLYYLSRSNLGSWAVSYAHADVGFVAGNAQAQVIEIVGD